MAAQPSYLSSPSRCRQPIKSCLAPRFHRRTSVNLPFHDPPAPKLLSVRSQLAKSDCRLELKMSASPDGTDASSAIDFLTLCHSLKTTKRKGWINHGIKGPESIADHMYRMSLMALIAGDPPGANRERCIKIAIVHDIAEVVFYPAPLHERCLEEPFYQYSCTLIPNPIHSAYPNPFPAPTHEDINDVANYVWSQMKGLRLDLTKLVQESLAGKIVDQDEVLSHLKSFKEFTQPQEIFTHSQALPRGQPSNRPLLPESASSAPTVSRDLGKKEKLLKKSQLVNCSGAWASTT